MHADMEKISGFGLVSVSPRAIECHIESFQSLAPGRKRCDLPVLKCHELTHSLHEGVPKLHLLSTDRSFSGVYSRRHVELPGLSIANVITSHFQIRTADESEKLLDITLVLEKAVTAKVSPQGSGMRLSKRLFHRRVIWSAATPARSHRFTTSGKARPGLRRKCR